MPVAEVRISSMTHVVIEIASQLQRGSQGLHVTYRQTPVIVEDSRRTNLLASKGASHPRHPLL